jgi:hypothetical protein
LKIAYTYLSNIYWRLPGTASKLGNSLMAVCDKEFIAISAFRL